MKYAKIGAHNYMRTDYFPKLSSDSAPSVPSGADDSHTVLSRMPKDLICRSPNPFGVFSFRFFSTVPATSKKLLIKHATSISIPYEIVVKNIISLQDSTVNACLCCLSCKNCGKKSVIAFSRPPPLKSHLPVPQSHHQGGYLSG